MSTLDFPIDPALARLIERCVLEFESEGEEAVERLLAASPELAAEARGRLEALRDAGVLLPPGSVGPMPEHIGAYRVLGVLGAGGMGRVYLAEQEAPIRRKVALKVVKPGIGSEDVLARFAIERQALALLDHPQIAKIYDAGATELGQPYFAMEYVDGRPITRWCDERGLLVDARLALFARVCDTVQHAHQKGILHRDLKPSNILVTEREGAAWPVLIDFGFAKALAGKPDLGSAHTQRGRMLGTPEYMSPEQAAYRLDLDTRSDVFSLGVVLYELLTGSLPIASSKLREASPTELERILSEEVPARPSIVMRRLHGDLDWIVMRALDKDRERRYAMAADLAADLRRYLAREPVLAGPPSSWYRIRRLAQKHRALVASAALVAVTLVAATVVSLLFAASAHRAESEAQTARKNAEGSLDKALEAAERLLIKIPGEKLRAFPEMAKTQRELLESGMDLCNSLLGGTRAGPNEDLRRAYVNALVARFLCELNQPAEALQRLDEAQALVDRAAPLLPGALGPLSSRVELLGRRADVLSSLDRHEDAILARVAALAEARALVARHQGPEARTLLDTARVRNAYTRLIHERPDAEATADALACLRELAARESPLEPKEVSLLGCLPVMAWSLFEQGHQDEARRLLTDAEQILRRVRRAHPDDDAVLEIMAPTLLRKGMVLRQLRDFAAATAEFERARNLLVRMHERAPGDVRLTEHLAVLHEELAVICSNTVRHADAVKEMNEAIALQEQVVAGLPASGHERARLGYQLAALAQTHEQWHELDPSAALEPALAAAQRAAAVMRELPPSDGASPSWAWERGSVSYRLGRLLAATGKHEAARQALEQAVTAWTELVAQRPQSARYRGALATAALEAGLTALELGDLAAARASLSASLEQGARVRDHAVNARAWADDQRRASLALAGIELASGRVAAFTAAVTRAHDLQPESSSHLHELARGLEAAAARAPAELRAAAVGRGLAFAERALGMFDAEVQEGEGRDSPMYVVVRARMLETEARLREGAGDHDAARAAFAEALGLHRRLFQERGQPRDRVRLCQSLASWVAHLQAHGTPEEVRDAQAEWDHVRGK